MTTFKHTKSSSKHNNIRPYPRQHHHHQYIEYYYKIMYKFTPTQNPAPRNVIIYSCEKSRFSPIHRFLHIYISQRNTLHVTHVHVHVLSTSFPS